MADAGGLGVSPNHSKEGGGQGVENRLINTITIYILTSIVSNCILI